MALLAFGLPPGVDAAVVASCADFSFIDHVYLERAVSAERRTRWLLLFGGEHAEPDPLLIALLRHGVPLQVVVDTDYNWRACELSLNEDVISVTFCALDQRVCEDDPNATLRGALELHLSRADADALPRGSSWSDAGRWQHWRRDSASPRTLIETAQPHGEDECGWAVDCVEVYDASWSDDWDEGDPSIDAEIAADYDADFRSAQSGDYAAALAAVDRALRSQFVRSDFSKLGTKQFNRACYLSRLGRLDEAVASLKSAVNNMPAFAADARIDDDLANVRAHPLFERAIKLPF
jgi:tetratricopeptide (TPR) repeat protein